MNPVMIFEERVKFEPQGHHVLMWDGDCGRVENGVFDHVVYVRVRYV